MSSSPLRSDARRDRERIVEAASELFAEHGADLSVDDSARRAGVGQATVFRRFPSKDDPVLAMFEQRITAAADAVGDIARAVDDPWEALAQAMACVAGRQASDRGTFQAVGSEAIGSPELREAGRGSPPPSRRCCAGPSGRASCATTWSPRTCSS
jgi:AcrR family transcriptional regulator